MSIYKHTRSVVAISVAAAAAVQARPATNEPAEADTTSCPAIDPDAIAALDRMGKFLQAQQSFTVQTKTETDYVLDTGQTVRLGARAELRVRRPDHLRADVVSARKARELFYDGKTFTIFAPRVGYYTRVAAPATIGALADSLEDRYGIELPLVDLFRWGTAKSGVDELTSAVHVGPAVIDGVDTEQYAFRQKGLDWQIWIQRDGAPLPRKLVLVATDDPARPQHAIAMTWQLGASHGDGVFAFAPPKDAVAIPVRDLFAPGSDAKNARHHVPR